MHNIEIIIVLQNLCKSTFTSSYCQISAAAMDTKKYTSTNYSSQKVNHVLFQKVKSMRVLVITGKPSRLVIYLPTIMFHFPPIPSSSSLLASLQSPITSSWQRHLVSAFGPFSFLFCSSRGYTLPTKKNCLLFQNWEGITVSCCNEDCIHKLQLEQ